LQPLDHHPLHQPLGQITSLQTARSHRPHPLSTQSCAAAELKGREAIVEFLTEFWNQQTDQRRHIFTNVIVDELTGETATVHAYLLLTAASGETMAPQTTGPYRLDLVKHGDSWRLQRMVAGFDAPF
jgi:hypothetical protein